METLFIAFLSRCNVSLGAVKSRPSRMPRMLDIFGINRGLSQWNASLRKYWNLFPQSIQDAEQRGRSTVNRQIELHFRLKRKRCGSGVGDNNISDSNHWLTDWFYCQWKSFSISTLIWNKNKSIRCSFKWAKFDSAGYCLHWCWLAAQDNYTNRGIINKVPFKMHNSLFRHHGISQLAAQLMWDYSLGNGIANVGLGISSRGLGTVKQKESLSFDHFMQMSAGFSVLLNPLMNYAIAQLPVNWNPNEQLATHCPCPMVDVCIIVYSFQKGKTIEAFENEMKCFCFFSHYPAINKTFHNQIKSCWFYEIWRSKTITNRWVL